MFKRLDGGLLNIVKWHIFVHLIRKSIRKESVTIN